MGFLLSATSESPRYGIGPPPKKNKEQLLQLLSYGWLITNIERTVRGVGHPSRCWDVKDTFLHDMNKLC